MKTSNRGISMPTVFFFSIFIMIFVFSFTALLNKENFMLLMDKNIRMARENALMGAMEIKSVVKHRLENEWIQTMPEPKSDTYILPINEDNLRDYINDRDFTGFLINEIDDVVISYYQTQGTTASRIFTALNDSDTTAYYKLPADTSPDYDAEIILTADRNASGWVAGWGEPNYAQIRFNYIVISTGTHRDAGGRLTSKTVELEGRLPITIHIKRETIAQYAYYVIHNKSNNELDARNAVWFGDGSSVPLFSGPVHVKRNNIWSRNNPVIGAKCTIDQGNNVWWWDGTGYIDIFDSGANSLQNNAEYNASFQENVQVENVNLDLSAVFPEQLRVATDDNMTRRNTETSFRSNQGVYLNPANHGTASFARISLASVNNRTELEVKTEMLDSSRNPIAGTSAVYTFLIDDTRDILVLCEGIMFVSGVIPKRARVTLASTGNLFVEGDLVYDTNVSQTANDDTVLGIVSWEGSILFTRPCKAHGVYVALGDANAEDTDTQIVGVGPEHHDDIKSGYPEGSMGNIAFYGGVLTKYAFPFLYFEDVNNDGKYEDYPVDENNLEGPWVKEVFGYQVDFTYDQYLNKGKTPPFFPCNGDYIVKSPSEDLRPVLYDSFKITYR